MDTSALGTSVTINGSTYNAVFRAAAGPVDLAGYEIQSLDPELRMAHADVVTESIAEGTAVTVDGTSYVVATAPATDSNGIDLIQLRIP